jgi:acyl-CoA reductase-like NAD-dependent aldehyde dehydrogenase
MSTSPAAYDGFDRMPIGESWRPGTVGQELVDIDPWSGAVLTRIPMASEADVKAACAAAEEEALRLVNDTEYPACGGEKPSGLGRFGGTWSIDEFTTHHWVSVRHTRRPYPMGARGGIGTDGA